MTHRETARRRDSLARAGGGADRRLLATAALLLVLALAWHGFASRIAPPLIESAYREESWRILSDVMAGRHRLPLEFYEAVWATRARSVLAGLLALAGAAALLALPAVQRRLRARARSAGVVATGMTPGRLRLANSVIAVALLGSFLAVAGATELWPFSPYSMYSGIENGEWVEGFRLFGVTGEPPREVLLDSPAFIRPFDPGRLEAAFVRLSLQPRPEPLYRRALSDLLRRYERHRRQGGHDGPRLRALRLYRVGWKPDPRRASLERPELRERLAEVNATPEAGRP